MQIASGSNSIAATSLSPLQERESLFSKGYLKAMNEIYPIVAYQTRDEINAADTELTQFKEDLKTKGPAQLLKDLDQAKIDALIEKYRQKLLKEKAAHPDQPMDIDKLVSDFKKKLLLEIEEAQKAEQKLKDNAQKVPLSTSDVLSGINMAQEANKASEKVLGFLEQMLNPTYNVTEKKESLLP